MTGLLCQQFQLSGFKDWQYNMISEVLKGKSTLIVQPTRAGKSLCYQFPPVWTGKTAIVLMPNISLMLDQAKAMQGKGIEAAYFGAGQPKEKKGVVVEKLRAGKLCLLFTTLESFFTSGGQLLPIFLEMAKHRKICLIALDKAHLITTWNSFR